MTLFRFLFAIDLAVAAVVAFFLSEGLAQGWISSFNIHIWVIAALAISAILAGGYLLHKNGQRWLANTVLAILALPGAVYGLFLAVVVFSGTTWN